MNHAGTWKLNFQFLVFISCTSCSFISTLMIRFSNFKNVELEVIKFQGIGVCMLLQLFFPALALLLLVTYFWRRLAGHPDLTSETWAVLQHFQSAKRQQLRPKLVSNKKLIINFFTSHIHHKNSWL